MPLTYAGADPVPDDVGERREWARKIKPQLAEGALVKVAGARNQAEAEFLQGMLLEEGVPSTLRRSAGFDVPDFLAAGPRDILVPEAGYEAARALLTGTEIGAEPERPQSALAEPPLRLLAKIALALAAAAALVWALWQLVG